MKIGYYIQKSVGWELGKFLFIFEEFLPEIVDFLQDRVDFSAQFEYSQRLLDLVFFVDLNGKLTKFNS
jgi:hypothetical protein